MSILHTVNKSAFERNAFDSCLGHAKAGDAILFIEDGVVNARKGANTNSRLAETMAACQVYALAADMAAKGMDEGDIVDGVKVVDYAGFVDLAEEHDVVQSWL